MSNILIALSRNSYIKPTKAQFTAYEKSLRNMPEIKDEEIHENGDISFYSEGVKYIVKPNGHMRRKA